MSPKTDALTLDQRAEILINEIVRKLNRGEECNVVKNESGHETLSVNFWGRWLIDCGPNVREYLEKLTLDRLLEEYVQIARRDDFKSSNEAFAFYVGIADHVRTNRNKVLKEFIGVLQKAAAELPR